MDVAAVATMPCAMTVRNGQGNQRQNYSEKLQQKSQPKGTICQVPKRESQVQKRTTGQPRESRCWSWMTMTMMDTDEKRNQMLLEACIHPLIQTVTTIIEYVAQTVSDINHNIRSFSTVSRDCHEVRKLVTHLYCLACDEFSHFKTQWHKLTSEANQSL